MAVRADTLNTRKEIRENQMRSNKRKILIDKFIIPQSAKKEFDVRVKINRDFIKTLPGFMEDSAYHRTDENSDFILVTVAIWENDDAIKKAKEAVRAKYQKEDFDMQGMLNRLGITMDRGIYEKTGD